MTELVFGHGEQHELTALDEIGDGHGHHTREHGLGPLEEFSGRRGGDAP